MLKSIDKYAYHCGVLALNGSGRFSALSSENTTAYADFMNGI